jgi:aminoglycoside 3-N-acetyltransferase
MMTHKDIVSILRILGLDKGDNVIVHSSLKAFGYVESGARTVIEALISVLGDKGTLIMPTFTLSFLMSESPVLDLIRTPSETGLITEVFRRHENVFRSKHITHSVAAWGKCAKEVASLESATAWGQSSPFQWLLDNGGKVLMLGVGYDRCTMIHRVEEDLQVPYRKMKSFPNAKTVLPDGKIEKNCSQVYYLRDNFKSDLSRIAELMEKSDINKTTMIGMAKIRIAGSFDIYQFTINAIRQEPNILLETIRL